MRLKKITALGLTLLAGGLLLNQMRLEKEMNPPAAVTGGQIRQYPSEKKRNPGIHGATFHLDNNRANKLNARRNPNLLTVAPNAFGPQNPFRPLIELEAAGPGNIHIHGTGPTKTVSFPVANGTQLIEIYPDFDMEQLTQGEPGEKETLKIYFEPTQGRRQLAVKETLTWSGPTEIFLSSKNLIDLAAITVNTPQAEPPNTPPEKWLEKLGEKIATKAIIYESEPGAAGWQKLRSESEIDSEKLANCLDISLLTANAAKKAGYTTEIIANSGHALCTISQGTNPGIFFEGTAYLKEKPKKTPPKKNLDGRVDPKAPIPEPLPTPSPKPAPNRAPPRNPEPQETFRISLPEWEPFFRKAPQTR